ncbi:MAG: hypothetical protein DA408_07600 [Bacteroidetes bacterium]|nr:MAG: hypothetical protein C7N36_16615 [Bacteroidota bacterium]PTM13249.1 MAG: hypothetical protein DA408_07600 [Bacteroidota bacterium]
MKNQYHLPAWVLLLLAALLSAQAASGSLLRYGRWGSYFFLVLLLLSVAYGTYRCWLSRKLHRVEIRYLREFEQTHAWLYRVLQKEIRAMLEVTDNMEKDSTRWFYQGVLQLRQKGKQLLQLLHQLQDQSVIQSGERLPLPEQSDISGYLDGLTEDLPKGLTESTIINNQDKAFLLAVIRIVEERLADEKFGSRELNQALNMSRSNLFRKLKALTGQSATSFIRNRRLEQARTLLSITNMNVSEVAYAVGFGSPKYFSRVFHTAFGMAPSMVPKRKRTKK